MQPRRFDVRSVNLDGQLVAKTPSDEQLSIRNSNIFAYDDRVISGPPSTVRETDRPEIAERKRVYEKSVRRGREVIFTFLDRDSQVEFENAYQRIGQMSQSTFENFEECANRNKNSSHLGRGKRILRFSDENMHAFESQDSKKVAPMLSVAASVSQALIEINDSNIVRSNYRRSISDDGWKPSPKERGIFGSSKIKDTTNIRAVLEALGYTDIRIALHDISNFADQIHTQYSRHLITQGLFSLEQGSVAEYMVNGGHARKIDRRPFIASSICTVRTAINEAANNDPESLGVVVDRVLDSVRKQLAYMYEHTYLDEKETSIYNEMSNICDTYLEVAEPKLENIFDNALRDRVAERIGDTTAIIPVDDPEEVDNVQPEMTTVVNEEIEALEETTEIIEIDPRQVELEIVYEYVSDILRQTREKRRPTKGTLRKEFLNEVMRDVKINFADLSKSPDTHDEAAYRIVGLLHSIWSERNGKTPAELQEHLTALVAQDTELAKLLSEVEQELQTTGADKKSPVTAELLHDANWLREHFESVINLIGIRLDETVAKQYIALLKSLFENDQWPQLAVNEVEVVNGFVSDILETEWPEDDIIAIEQVDLPPLTIDEELIAIAEQLDIVAFPPTKDRYPRIIEDVLKHVPKDQQQFIERWRMRLLENLATENNGNIYRTQSGSFGTKIPWYVAHLTIKGKHVAVVEHPLEGNATYLIVNDEPKFWEELVSKFNRTGAREFGAAQVVHPLKDSPSRLRHHKAKLGDRLQDLLTVR